jgi:hypothetical protein
VKVVAISIAMSASAFLASGCAGTRVLALERAEFAGEATFRGQRVWQVEAFTLEDLEPLNGTRWAEEVMLLFTVDGVPAWGAALPYVALEDPRKLFHR